VSKIKVLRERDEKQSNEQAAAVWRDEQFGFISRRANTSRFRNDSCIGRGSWPQKDCADRNLKAAINTPIKPPLVTRSLATQSTFKETVFRAVHGVSVREEAEMMRAVVRRSVAPRLHPGKEMPWSVVGAQK
jgi:hypothetical protein